MSNWTPHSFRLNALDQGCDPDFVEMLISEGEIIRKNGFPVIFTLRHLTKFSDTPHRIVEDIVKRKSNPYEVFKLRKRSGKGYRHIAIPDAPLLGLQRWIHEKLLSQQTPHSASTAFSAGCDPLKNAQLHCGAKWLVKMDITDFFEAISERQVYRVFKSFGYRPLLAFQMARICTRISPESLKYRNKRWRTKGQEIGHLPQGAPTSPLLANLVCLKLDQSLQKIAEDYGCVYSRYADDLVFSANDFNRSKSSELIKKTSVELGAMGFRRNRQKTNVCPPGTRKIVTGLLVDQAEPRLTREFRERIEVHLFYAKKHGVIDHSKQRKFRSPLGFRAHLHGLITYAEHVHPEFGGKCRLKFNALPWGDFAEVPLFL